MRKLHQLVCGLLIAFGLSNLAIAASINVDFGDYVAPDTFGAVGEVGAWNKINSLGITTNLFDTSSFSTSVSLTLSASSAGGAAALPTTDAEKLLFDNFFRQSSDNTDWTVDLAGLSDGLTRLIIYAPSNTLVSTGLMTINSISYSELFGSATADVIEGVSYMIIETNVTGGALSLSGTTVGSLKNNAGLAGIQLSSVPIPATVWLFGSGLLGLVGVARRKKA